MSEKRVVLKKYLLSRLGKDSHVLLQQHPENGKEICVIKKKVGAIDAQFMAAVQQQADDSGVHCKSSDSTLRLEAKTGDHLDFLFKC